MLLTTFSLPAGAVTLDRTLETHPEITVEAERLAAHSTEWTLPDIWIANVDFDAVDETLREDPTVDTVVDSYEFDEEKFYHVKWSEPVIERINQYIDMGGTILNASAGSNGWRVRIRFASRDQFENFRNHVQDQGYRYDLLELTEPGTPRRAFGRLTPQQRNALVVAVESGYYDIPRRTSSEALADRMDISQQALSERLRRGVNNLVDSTLTTQERGGSGGPST